MTKPDYVILLDGRKYITTSTAALMIGVNRNRILQFITAGLLSSKQLPRSKDRIIPLEEFQRFAKKPRLPGRPSTKKTAKKASKKERK